MAHVWRCDNRLLTEQEHFNRLKNDSQLHRRSRSPKIGTHHRKEPWKNESCQLRGLAYCGSFQKSPLQIRDLDRRAGPCRSLHGRLWRGTWDGVSPRTQSYPNATGEMLGDHRPQSHSNLQASSNKVILEWSRPYNWKEGSHERNLHLWLYHWWKKWLLRKLSQTKSRRY